MLLRSRHLATLLVALSTVGVGGAHSVLAQDPPVTLRFAIADDEGRPSDPYVRAFVDGEDAVIEVHNDGEPIPPDRLGGVFQPFWRRTASREGLGLGLYICSQIAKSHAGHLVATSSAAQGTTFVARLPIRA